MGTVVCLVVSRKLPSEVGSLTRRMWIYPGAGQGSASSFTPLPMTRVFQLREVQQVPLMTGAVKVCLQELSLVEALRRSRAGNFGLMLSQHAPLHVMRAS